MLELLAEFISSYGFGAVGQQVFVDFAPIEKPGLLLKSNLAGDPIDQYLPGFVRGSFMLVSRAPDYASAKDLIERAVAALEEGTKHQVTLGSTVFRSVRARTKPFTFPPAQGSFREFAVTLDVVYVDGA